MDPTAIGTLVAQVGFPIAMVIYFLLRDQKRDKKQETEKEALVGRIQHLEEQRLEDYRQYNGEMIKVISKNTAVMQQLCDILRERPCLVATDDVAVVRTKSGSDIPSPMYDDTDKLTRQKHGD